MAKYVKSGQYNRGRLAWCQRLIGCFSAQGTGAATASTLVHADEKPDDMIGKQETVWKIITKRNTKDAGKDANGRHLTLDLEGKVRQSHSTGGTAPVNSDAAVSGPDRVQIDRSSPDRRCSDCLAASPPLAPPQPPRTPSTHPGFTDHMAANATPCPTHQWQ